MQVFRIKESTPRMVHDCTETFDFNSLGLKGFNMKFAQQLPHTKTTGKVPVEHAIFVVFGELTVSTPGNSPVKLGPYDSVHFESGEERCFENQTDNKVGVLIVDTGRPNFPPGAPMPPPPK
jgi:hypothetical protein